VSFSSSSSLSFLSQSQIVRANPNEVNCDNDIFVLNIDFETKINKQINKFDESYMVLNGVGVLLV
jgi:hypothetical protein